MGTWAKPSTSCPLRSWFNDPEPDRKVLSGKD
jgi:hypothetical protein